MLPYKQLRFFSEFYMRVSLSLFLVCFLVCSVQAEKKLEFNRDIRPILSDGCFHCHGPDEKERKGIVELVQMLSTLDHNASSDEIQSIIFAIGKKLEYENFKKFKTILHQKMKDI